MSVPHRRIPPSRLSAAAAGETPAAPYGTSAAVESPPGSTPNAPQDVPCPVPPPGTQGPHATPKPSGGRSAPGLAAGLRPGRRLASGGDAQPVGSGLVTRFRLGRGLRRGCPAGWSWARRRGSVSADAAFGGSIQPVGPGSGGGPPFRRAPGVRRDVLPVGPGPGGGASFWWTWCVGAASSVGAQPDRESGTGSSGLCRTESSAPARRGSVGPTVRPRQDRGHRTPTRPRPQSAWTRRSRSRRLLRGDPAPPRPTPSRPTLRNPLR